MKAKSFVDALETWSLRSGSMHVRLSAAIEDAIRRGTLRAGAKMPAERHLASLLAVSRTTVVSAYNSLRRDGWIESRIGSGTWISRNRATEARSSFRMKELAQSPILHASGPNIDGIIDLASAMTPPLAEAVMSSLVPSEDHAKRMLTDAAHMPYGLPELRASVADHFRRNGTPTDPDEVLITNGGQQAISLLVALLLQPGAIALVENPTYYGALEALRLSGARLSPLAVEKDHVCHETARQKMRALHPQMIYLTPTGHNPTGVTMPESTRSMLAKHCGQYGVPIVEDEIMADLTFARRKPRPIAAFDCAEMVVTIGSLSRVIWPSLRIGWIRAPKSMIARLAKFKTAMDFSCPLITQSLAVDLFASFSEFREQRCTELVERRNALTDLLSESLPDATFTVPPAGLSFWVRIPGIDTRILAQAAIRRGVNISHGSLYSINDSHSEFLRIPFVLSSDLLGDGVHRLRMALDDISGHSKDLAYRTPPAERLKNTGTQVVEYATALSML